MVAGLSFNRVKAFQTSVGNIFSNFRQVDGDDLWVRHGDVIRRRGRVLSRACTLKVVFDVALRSVHAFLDV